MFLQLRSLPSTSRAVPGVACPSRESWLEAARPLGALRLPHFSRPVSGPRIWADTTEGLVGSRPGCSGLKPCKLERVFRHVLVCRCCFETPVSHH